MGIELFVVMPVHDEAECVHGVVVDWMAPDPRWADVGVCGLPM